MNTLYIKVKDQETYRQLLKLLKGFDRSELEFVEEENSFSSGRDQIKPQSRAIDTCESSLTEIDEFDRYLEEVISRNEN